MRKNEVLSHPDIPNEKPINVSVQKCIDSEGQHFSAVTFSDEHLDDKLGKVMFDSNSFVTKKIPVFRYHHHISIQEISLKDL